MNCCTICSSDKTYREKEKEKWRKDPATHKQLCGRCYMRMMAKRRRFWEKERERELFSMPITQLMKEFI